MGSNINVENTKDLAKKLSARNFAIAKLEAINIWEAIEKKI